MGAVNGTQNGAFLSEPEEYWDLAIMLNHTQNVTTNICLPPGYNSISSFGGLFLSRDPLNYSGPLIVMQMLLASSVILITSVFLKPLGQPLMVSQILGGIILGPLLLGEKFARKFFPLVSFVMLDLVASLGIMFYNFLIGVQTDPSIIKQAGWKASAIAISASIFSMALPVLCHYLINDYISDELKDTIPSIARAQMTYTFPTIVRYLYELNILNSEFGRVALSSSIIGGHISFFYQKFNFHDVQTNWAEIIVPGLLFVLVIIFVIKPAALRMIKLGNDWEALKQICFCSVFVAVLVTGLLSHVIGYNVIFGPFILGLVIPTGPPIGTEVVNRIEFIVSWMFMPIYYAKLGMGMNFDHKVMENAPWVGLIIFLGFIGKFFGAFIGSYFCGIPLIDSIFLGLVINVKGVIELAIFKGMRRRKLISHGTYVTMCISLLVITWVITSLIRAYYNPTRRYIIYSMRTIMDSKPNTELRLLLCMHTEESVASIINILEASYHTEDSPIEAFIIHLVDLAGRATPLFISHKSFRKTVPEASLSEHIVNALRNYEVNQNHKSIKVHPFTAITHKANMKEDVCLLALEKRTSLIIIPFHMNRTARGTNSTFARNCRNMNLKILDDAPCSVAILIERSLKPYWYCAYASWCSFRVAVLFLGGPDDREALAYGARMSGHPKTNLTVIRFVADDSTNCGEMSETKMDDDFAMIDFKLLMWDNDRVRYTEEVIIDGSGTLRVIQALGNDFELIMVGRRHDKHSSFIKGLAEWNEYTELGTIGDLLASSDFKGDAMILVLQQHDSAGQRTIGN